jgi:hypothetical protein
VGGRGLFVLFVVGLEPALGLLLYISPAAGGVVWLVGLSGTFLRFGTYSAAGGVQLVGGGPKCGMSRRIRVIVVKSP